ncbi:hypothetical protein [Hymenobacter jeollabukensis]|uniref:DUF4852 domain-containing protein n=1 Tax=Hymenobacter jeollabukensis TaxID=2025313 RepID=A0A5R8WWK1_9BACT|nr:hypothetical protein [Hymenobacter jeollabukensis]TLM96888.1 hypothetical protein FDY95_02530 [Hymenobacter jeollabukensis]
MNTTFQPRLSQLLLLGFALGVTPAVAQQTTNGAAQPANYNKTNIAPGEFQAYNTFDHRYEGLVGTPYLSKGWSMAKVTLADKRELAGAPARYDVYRRVLVVQPYANKKDSVWLDANRMKEFSLLPVLPGQAERRFLPFAEAPDAEKRTAFVEVLYQGASGYALLKLPRKLMVKANYQGGYAADRRFDELVDRTEYYLRRPDGSVVEVKLNQKSIAGAAPALAALGQTKRTVKTEQDAVELLRAADPAK